MQIYNITMVPFIMGVVELLKMLGLPKKFAALASVVLGAVIGIVYINPNDILQGLLIGLSLGLSASGLYSGTKNTIEAFNK
ncbi:MAG: hypothetical protein GX974_03650 [Clostridiales bacterium]|nr:hypothetical protein [Clostridiales bacterium]